MKYLISKYGNIYITKTLPSAKYTKKKRQKQHKELEIKLIFPKKENLNQKMYQLYLLLTAGLGSQ